MQHTKLKITYLFLLFAIVSNAQELPTATGGDATGAGGSSAYSVGQVVYTTNTAATGSVAQGVQQPYEISIFLGIEDNQISLNMQLYPNPSVALITLNVGKQNLENLSFQLFDVQGKLLQNQKLTSIETSIRVEEYKAGNYFLKVINNNKEVKTFKIIKN